jgi:hypothetical protein
VEPQPPRVGVSPQQAVVRLPTWLWVEDGYWRPRSASEATWAAPRNPDTVTG